MTIEWSVRFTHTFPDKLEDKFYNKAFLMRMITLYISDRFTKTTFRVLKPQYLFRVSVHGIATFFSLSSNLLCITDLSAALLVNKYYHVFCFTSSMYYFYENMTFLPLSKSFMTMYIVQYDTTRIYVFHILNRVHNYIVNNCILHILI